MNKNISELNKRLVDISRLGSVIGLLDWDREVMMPKKASEHRAKSMSLLGGIVHEKFVNINTDGLLTTLKKEYESGKLNEKESAIFTNIWRSFEKEKKLPEDFIKEIMEAASLSQDAWAKARQKKSFKLFLPHLEKMVTLRKKEAELLGYEKTPYDALLDNYEPLMKSEDTTQVLEDLKNFLIPFIQKIKSSRIKVNDKILEGEFPMEKQIAFNTMIAGKLGFDFEAGRLDVSTHPFTQGDHAHDVRITTRYKDNDLFYSLGSTIHETGHAIYGQGLLPEHYGTPIGEPISCGIHESQSRMWENNIGKSKEFAQFILVSLKKEFPKVFSKVSVDELYKAINKVEPLYIRTEADEVTYNLHIILRYEIEKDLIEGKIKVKDLPQIWNKKFKEYFGLKVPNDAMGILQDVHWSFGGMGYFPTYTLGNLYAAQFYHTMSKKLPNIKKDIAKGNFKPIKKWLNANIHAKGKLYSAEALVKKVTGEKLDAKYFIEYLKDKYQEIYSL